MGLPVRERCSDQYPLFFTDPPPPHAAAPQQRFTIEAVVRVVGVTAYLFWSQWQLGVIAVVLVPVFSFASKVYGAAPSGYAPATHPSAQRAGGRESSLPPHQLSLSTGKLMEDNATKVQTASAKANEVRCLPSTGAPCARPAPPFAHHPGFRASALNLPRWRRTPSARSARSSPSQGRPSSAAATGAAAATPAALAPLTQALAPALNLFPITCYPPRTPRRECVQRSFALNMKQGLLQSVYYAVVNTFLTRVVLQGAFLYVGCALVLDGRMAASRLVAVMLYQGNLGAQERERLNPIVTGAVREPDRPARRFCTGPAESFSNLLNSAASLFKSSGSAAAVFALLDRTPAADRARSRGRPTPAARRPPAPHAASLPTTGIATCDAQFFAPASHRTQGVVEFSGVHFAYPSRGVPVLRGISFRALPGTVTALVGPSGAGAPGRARRLPLRRALLCFPPPDRDCPLRREMRQLNENRAQPRRAAQASPRCSTFSSGSTSRRGGPCSWTARTSASSPTRGCTPSSASSRRSRCGQEAALAAERGGGAGS